MLFILSFITWPLLGSKESSIKTTAIDVYQIHNITLIKVLNSETNGGSFKHMAIIHTMPYSHKVYTG